MLTYFEEGVDLFHTFNLGPVVQRPAKLLAVKFGGLEKKLPLSLGPTRTGCPRFEFVQGRIILKVGWPVTL